MKSFWIWVIVIIIVIAGGIWWWQSSQSPAAPLPAPAVTPSTSTQPAATSTTSSAPMSATVTYDGSSFAPSTVTIAQGGTVIFTDTNGQMWVASDPHPIHNGYDGTTMQEHCAPGYSGAAPFDQCSPGATFTFTFDKVGSWGYHNHLHPSDTGTVDVVAQ